MIKESEEEFVVRCVSEARVDIDIELCETNNIKFPSRGDEESEDEIWARLADTQRNRKIFDFITNLLDNIKNSSYLCVRIKNNKIKKKMIINHELISFDTDKCYFPFNEDEYQIARFLKGAYSENKPRFKKRFVDFYNTKFKAMYFEYFSDIIENIEKIWDVVTPFSYKEAFEIKNKEFRALVFSSINVSEMIKELGVTRVNTEGKDLVNKTWNKYLQKFEEVKYSVIYELYHVNGEKLGIETSTLPIVKCWCTTTDSEHWLWVDNASFSNNSPLEAIASTCVIYKSMEGKIKHIIRQGDVFLFEMTEDVIPSESEELISLPMNQYFNLLKSQA